MYNIKITNDTINKKLSAVNDNNDIIEIILCDSVILYNKIKQNIHSYSNNTDILYLAISLRKYMFDNIYFYENYLNIITSLRKITTSYPIPANVKITNYNIL